MGELFEAHGDGVCDLFFKKKIKNKKVVRVCCLYRVVVDIVAKRVLDIYPIRIVFKGR